ncbi:Receptor-like serine/threonine-protein kinase SD1-8 [Dendrobium catenatum]|uniref:Receptor-like serine/threonine-protein kinase SD1-8 n=1 Tax=Dendrobium catenatum TaxID=906689 RepID=A0A2I0VCZ8_9ASPA|nr:Receptor-like serine/threonine-protein kinase SD1-8 [Dendrobium catenatum]
MTREPIFPNLVIILFFFFSISFAIDILTPSHPLSYKETLISANGTFALGFFTPPNTTNSYIGIWYHNLAVQTVVWVANRRNPISSPSFPNSIPNPVAQLLDTGNLIIRASNSSSHLWQSFDYPTDTLLSGMKLGPELKIGIDRNLTAWLSNSDPSPGKYSLAIDTIGVPQLVIRDLSGSWIWRGGPWNGFGFTGDEFLVVRGTTLPDTTAAVADMSLGLVECKTRCLMNCSCKAYASVYLNGGGGFGCIVWMTEIKDLRSSADDRQQDLFVRIASSEEEQLVSSVNWGHEIMHEANKEGNSEISFFKFAQVVSATNNFSDINKLGEGGFGPVYKGKLPEGQDVAIKRLSARSGQGLEEFKNEILLIAKLQHRNLVRLLGCCIHGEEKMLIYEFMPNKSLDLLLFDVEQRLKLYWTRRFQIIEGIAQGLLYLHKHSRLRIIHRDLKASNILLDGDMNPKISDFGMARIFDSNDTQANTRRIVGTFGYMSPEYALNGLFSVKSDVYSFGVLLLEIVSGRRNHGLLHQAWGLWKEGTWAELVDPSLDNKFQNNEVARCIYVALLCVQERPEDRPFMSDIVTMLANESLYFNSIKQPAFFTIDNDLDARNPLNQHVSTSFNDLSISIVAGR